MPRKTTRSFKELSEVLIAQVDWLASNSYIGASKQAVFEK
jgi:hypothetical protein